ncbi:MAG: ATP-binding protein [Muribaculaceae bacterium]|nr:ATP-binding protein [Muribaculaceae bacterium]
MWINRVLSSKIEQLSHKFPIITLTGPRQSGKSSLLRKVFPDYKYVSLENPDIRDFATNDPKGFISTYAEKVIIDEAQRVPQLFSYIQTHVDEHNQPGMYMLAGSQNFHLMAAIDQSLAGRTAVLRLLPLSRGELHQAGILPESADEQIFRGFYPRLYSMDIDPLDFYPSYTATYVERDVRSLMRIGDLNKFTRFLRLCAGRIGQLLNMSSLATETGVTIPTIESWISILEASYILYRLEPDYNNYNKRIVKTPKLYFYDTGLACSLLGIRTAEQIDTHYMRGALFENMVINQFVKDAFNAGQNPDITFWRDSTGLEVDLVRTVGMEQFGYEIKSGQTFKPDFFKSLSKWGQLSSTPPERLSVIYGGEESLQTSSGRVIPLSTCFGSIVE